MTLLTVTGVLDEDTLALVDQTLPRLKWRDGKVTAGKEARRVKHNEQADLAASDAAPLRSALSSAITRHPVVQAAARPRRFSPLMISKTADAGQYGAHVDNALMGQGDKRLRTDLSFTLFLTDPGDYEGGELILHTAAGTQRLKGDKGDLVLYSTSEIHEVAPVTEGTRVVCVGWIESLIRDGAGRALLFDLENLRVSLRQQLQPGCAELLTLDKAIANLLRMWAET